MKVSFEQKGHGLLFLPGFQLVRRYEKSISSLASNFEKNVLASSRLVNQLSFGEYGAWSTLRIKHPDNSAKDQIN